MKSRIPKYIREVIDRLEKAGYEAFIVGGSVRDLLLKKEPSDYDITTSARPEESMKVFKDYKTILTGVEFGTVNVLVENNHVEITTYRREEDYEDGRKPSKVYFTNKLEGDLSRRDFTINAMAYNEDSGVVDYFKGKEDLDKRIIKTVGDPRERFKEDHLRILRALRFASQLNFSLEKETYQACKDLAPLLERISAERIRDELFKLLLSPKPSYGIRLMEELGILKVILPELVATVDFDQRNPWHDKNLFDHTLCVLDRTAPILSIRLAALLHDIGKPPSMVLGEDGIGHFHGHDRLGAEMTDQVLTRLHCSKDLIDKVRTFVKEHMTQYSTIGDKGLKRLIARVGRDEIFNLLELQKADGLCTISTADISDLLEKENEIKRILEEEEAYEKKQLDISGKDIINLGYKEGKIIGIILDHLMDQVLENPKLNKKDLLIERVKEGENKWENYLEQME